MAYSANQHIDITYALREQGPNVFMLTEGAESNIHTPQIFICRKREVAPSFLGDFYYLDSYDTKATAHITPDVASAMASWKHKQKYVATVDSQIEFSVKRRLFDAISEYLYPAWLPDHVFLSLSDQPSAFFVVLRVYRIAEGIPDELLQKGRQGAAMIYRLYSNDNYASHTVRTLQPVLSDAKFDYIKRELIHTIKIENAFIECYENNEYGRKALEAKAEIRRAFAPKRAYEGQPVDRAHLDYDTIYDRILQIDPSLVGLIQTVKATTPPQWGEANIMVKRAKNGDSSARIRLFEMFLRIVLKNALWMHETYEVPLDDAIQEGSIGLLLAIEKYDASDEQSKFSVYAPWWMRQNMMRELPVHERIMRLPIHFREKIIKITPLVDNHVCNECGRVAPCHNLIESIQSELDCDYSSAIWIWSFTQHPLSVEVLRQGENTSGQTGDYGAQITGVEEAIDSEKLAAVVDCVLSGLKQREREILEMRHGLTGRAPMTLEEIGAKYDLTRERIRQLENKAIKRLRHPSRANLLRPFL